MANTHQNKYTTIRFITKFTAILWALTLGFLATGCQAKEKEPVPKKEVEEVVEQKVSPLETEVLKMLRKEKFDRDLIFEKSKELDLKAKLALVNRLTKAHNIERMNMLKARVQMGTINSKQNIEKSEERSKKALDDINAILREKAKKEGRIK